MTLREAIEALPRFAMAQYATDEPYPDAEGWIIDRADALEVIARFESPSPEGLDMERLIRSDRFREAVRDVFMAPGEWGPAQGYYAESIELFIDALAARLAEEPDDG